MPTTADFTPYKLSDFFFNQNPAGFTINCTPNGNKCWGQNPDNSKVKDSAGAEIYIDNKFDFKAPIICNTLNNCTDQYKKQLIYNKVIYNKMYNFQTNNQAGDTRYDDLVNKYNQDVFTIGMNTVGIIFILVILYKL
jgi:hypothetical protein